MCIVPCERLLGHFLCTHTFPLPYSAAEGRTHSTLVLRWTTRPSPSLRPSFLWTPAGAILTKGPPPLFCHPHLPFMTQPHTLLQEGSSTHPCPGGSLSTNPLTTQSKSLLRTACFPIKIKFSFPCWNPQGQDFVTCQTRDFPE